MNTQFKINGLTCPACERLSAKRLYKIVGVSSATVSRDSGLANIEADREITLAEVNEALKETEYRAEPIN